MEKVLEIDKLAFSYNGGQVLRNVSLSLNEGDYIAILGPNGGGKTTLLKCILGLLSPQQGNVRVFGKSPNKVRNKIGYVPQNTVPRANMPIPVLDAVIMGAITSKSSIFNGGWKRTANTKKRAQECLARVGLEGYDSARVSDLSGGQRQRVIVARALMDQPQLLLLDEPTANIDPQGKFCFYEFLADLPGTITTIVVSHDLSIAASGFSGIAVVNQTLSFTRGGGLTEELLGQLYGEHDASCPMGTFIANASNLLPSVMNAEAPATERGES